MRAFQSLKIDNELLEENGHCDKEGDVITIDFDARFGAKKFVTLQKKNKIIQSIDFYEESTFSWRGPFFIESVRDTTVTLIKG